MVWREGKDHIMDCYFCMINLKRNESQEQAPCPIPQCSFDHKTNPSCPNLPVPEPVGNMEYSFDSEHSDMAVIARDNAYKLGQPASTLDTSRTQPNMRTEPFKEFCSAAGFTSKRETSVGNRNNVLLVSKQ